MGLNKGKMYLIIILITLFHWIGSIIWIILKKIDTKTCYSVDQKEFLRCNYPISKNLRYI